MKILHDEDLSDYSFKEINDYSDGVKKVPEDEHIVYMENGDKYKDPYFDGYYEGYELQPKIARGEYLIGWGVKSVMTVCQITKERYFSMSDETSYFDDFREGVDDFWFTKDKEDIREMWKNKDYKSLVVSSHSDVTEHQFRKYHNLFEKGKSNKTQREEGGVFIGILNGLNDFRKYN